MNHSALKDKDEPYILRVICHEVAHAALSEMREWNPRWKELSPYGATGRNAIKHEERVVDCVSSGTYKLLVRIAELEQAIRNSVEVEM